MKDLLVGLSTTFTAFAVIVTALFEFVFRDVKKLRDAIKGKDPSLGAHEAEQQASTTRRKQKLRLLLPLLVFALGCSITALFISEGGESRSAPARTHSNRDAERGRQFRDALEGSRTSRRAPDAIQNLAGGVGRA